MELISFPLPTCISVFLWSFYRGFMPRLVWKHACPLSSRAGKAASGFSRVDIGIGGFLSRCHRAVTSVIMFLVNPQGDRRACAGESGVSGVHWDIGVFEMVARPWKLLSSVEIVSS